MDFDFNPEEVRVLGALIEKRLSTPAHYPLTMNSLITACNQSSNRDPVVDYDQELVNEALISTRQRGFSFIFTQAGARVPKFKENLCPKLELDDAQAAVLAELMLRGPQTPGELRQRTTRMFNFDELSAVEEVLTRLAGRETPLVVQLPRQPGKREARYAHLLSGEIDLDELAEQAAAAPSGSSRSRTAELEERIATLEQQMAEVLAVIKELR